MIILQSEFGGAAVQVLFHCTDLYLMRLMAVKYINTSSYSSVRQLYSRTNYCL